MRYRIGNAQALCIGRNVDTSFGLTNCTEGLSNEQRWLIEEIREEFIKQFASWYEEGCLYKADFGVYNDRIFIGWEPSYQYEPLNIIRFDLGCKDLSYRLYGTAFGPYGTNVVKKIKYYKDYKNKNKYVRFIDTYYYKLVDLFKNNS